MHSLYPTRTRKPLQGDEAKIPHSHPYSPLIPYNQRGCGSSGDRAFSRFEGEESPNCGAFDGFPSRPRTTVLANSKAEQSDGKCNRKIPLRNKDEGGRMKDEKRIFHPSDFILHPCSQQG